MNLRPEAPPGPLKPAKRSIWGLLFNPQFGASIAPLRQTTRIFLQLVAAVFATYRLIPRDYPGLRDETSHLTLSGIIGTAWQNLRFTREALPQIILFFAITGMMAFSALAGISAFFSLFIGHAHAQTASMFTPGSQDVAQTWLNYLFIGPNSGLSSTSFVPLSDTYGDTTASMADPFKGSIALQSALISALAMYSDAILIVAAIILFYHLASMVVETAHHGQVMGKRANQIWAPIRLVVAIGLLVPVNGGLSCGQLLVIKVAELGSGLASTVWGGFLTTLANYNTKPVVPSGPLVQQVAIDLIRMEACMISYNDHVKDINKAGGPQFKPMTLVTEAGTNVGNVPGNTYHYNGGDGDDIDFCGWYFVPSGGLDTAAGGSTSSSTSSFANQLEQAAAQAQTQAINDNLTQNFDPVAAKILAVETDKGTAASSTATMQTLSFSPAFLDAIGQYQQDVNAKIAAIVNQMPVSQITTAVNTIKPYGWVMAGTFLNTIDRMQADIASAAASSIPRTQGPKLQDQIGNSNRLHDDVAHDMANFDTFQYGSINNAPSTSNAACSAMVGLSYIPKDDDNGLIGYIWLVVERFAQAHHVWTVDPNGDCSGATVQGGENTFSIGVQISGNDPLSQMAFLGHSMIGTALHLVGWGLALQGGGTFLDGLDPTNNKLIQAKIDKESNPNTHAVLGAFADVTSGAAKALGGIFLFLALVFWTAGFILAFLLPIMPFMRFFFAVLGWVGAIVEAIIAIPLVALAHLNPEGDGLAGASAKQAYFFIFNLFLRPVLVVFGLIVGLIMFMLTMTFLNYGFAIAVSGAGATTSPYATLSRLVYSIIYVGMLYVSANHCFQMVEHLPEQALAWMGARGQAIQKMGDAEKLEGIGTVISGYAGNQAMQTLGASSQQFAQGLGKGTGNVMSTLFGKSSSATAEIGAGGAGGTPTPPATPPKV